MTGAQQTSAAHHRLEGGGARAGLWRCTRNSFVCRGTVSCAVAVHSGVLRKTLE
jgi:uncharacterized cupin superfamily protein